MHRHTLKRGVLLAALVAAFVGTAASRADAAFNAWICSNELCSGGTVVSVTDNGATDADPTVGSIVLVGGPVGGLTTTVNVSTSKPILAEPSMDLNFTGSGIGTAYFYAQDTGFSIVSSLSGTIGGTIGGSGTVEGIVIIDGDLGGAASTGVLVGNPFDGALSHPGATGAPYVMTLGVKVVRTTTGITTGDFLVVPEPASLALVGLGLAGLAARRRRQSR